MSHGYGSLRGVIGFCLVVVSAVLLMGSFAVADSPAPSAGAGTEVLVAATIAPVRIVVVDKHDRITEILSNGPGDITPSIHRLNSEGPAVAMNPSISWQYATIMRRIDQHKTGTLYRRQDQKKLPLGKIALVSTLLSGARFVL